MDAAEFKHIRASLGLTQSQFAKQLGLSRVMVGLMERGQKAISPRTARAVRSATPIPLESKPRSFDPIMRSVERVLIETGVEYEVDFFMGDLLCDFYLNEVALGLVIRRSIRAEPFPKIPDVDVMLVNGKIAIAALIGMLESGGGGIARNKGHDPYQSSLASSKKGAD